MDYVQKTVFFAYSRKNKALINKNAPQKTNYTACITGDVKIKVYLKIKPRRR
jgi:hypothetical protein